MVNRVDVNSVLMQMRQVKTQLRSQQEQMSASQLQQPINPSLSARTTTQVTSGSSVGGINPASFQSQLNQQLDTAIGTAASGQPQRGDNNVPDFQAMLGNAVNGVNATQQHSASLASRFEQGDPTIDLPEVMIAMQKSSVSFQAMTQVRNKLVEAYKDVMNMPL